VRGGEGLIDSLMEAAEGYPRVGVAQGPIVVLACRRLRGARHLAPVRARILMRHERRTARRAAACAVGLATILLAGCAATDKQVIDQAETIHKDLKPAVMDDPQLEAYFKTIGDRIVAAGLEEDRAHPDVPPTHLVKGEGNAWMFKHGEFHLVNSSTLNAFTTGGDHMYIYNELFQLCRTEEELASVMAHEYGHVYARHVHEGINRTTAAFVWSGVVGVGGYLVGGKAHGAEYGKTAFASALTVGTGVNMSYTEKDEAEADDLGLKFYARAGWDPERFGDFFQQLIDRGFEAKPGVPRDHPPLSARVAAAKAAAAKLGPEAQAWRRSAIETPIRFAALQRRAAIIGESTPTDVQVQKAQTLLTAVSSCLTPVDQPDQLGAKQSLVQATQAAPAPHAP
jgi:Zn-dependent protease with chaperone function